MQRAWPVSCHGSPAGLTLKQILGGRFPQAGGANLELITETPPKKDSQILAYQHMGKLL